MEIRPCRASDLSALHAIALATGDAGNDAHGLYDGDLLAAVFVDPYVRFEPDLAFVASDEMGVAGYVLGTIDARSLNERLHAEWWPALRERYPLDTDVPAQQRWLVERVHCTVRAPRFITDRYPSEFHIDLLPRCQGQGVGRRLIEQFCGAIRQAGSPGVHCGVDDRNTNAIAFYEHLDFTQIVTEHGSLFVRAT